MMRARTVLATLATLTAGACSPDGPGTDAAGGSSSGGQTPSGGSSPGSGGLATGGSGGAAVGGSSSGGGAPSAGGGAAVGGSGGSFGPCTNAEPALAVTRRDTTVVSELGRPFDPDEQDDSGPGSWEARYGKTPEIVAVPDGAGLAVLYQDQDQADSAFVVHVSASGASYVIDAAFEVGSLGRIMGLTLDDSGSYYVATGVSEDEQVDAVYPPNLIHRPDIVRVVKFDGSGCVTMESDVDMARAAFAEATNEDNEIIVNPMVAATSRLAYGGGQLVLVHGHNTEPDPDLDGTRHQKAITTHIDAESGLVTRASSMWVSHSFDQRAFYDGTGLVELHLGDAYPRAIAFGRYLATAGDGDYPLFAIKGETGDNRTFSRLGGIVQVSDGTFGYMVALSTERTATISGDDELQGTRDLAILRIRTDFADTSEPIVEEGAELGSLPVSSGGEDVTNYLRWLTDLGPDRHVERPRIVALPSGEVVLLWEEWTVSGSSDQYQGTFAMTVDAQGQTIAGPSEVSGDHHLPRGDDAVRLGDRAAYVTGSPEGLHLNLVAADLTSERITLP
jgi:hypothetical protein